MSGQRRSVEEHAARIRALVQPVIDGLGVEPVPLAQALGRVLAADVRAPIALPPFRNSQMDGYAARAVDLAGAPVVLPVDGVQAAGRAEPRALRPGTVRKVMTGAPLPEGADCVVPVERAEPAGDGVRLLEAPPVGTFVREAGSDAAAGTVLADAGTRLAPRHLAACAAAGVDVVAVRARLRVAVLTTGTEIVEPGTPLAHGEVYDANRTALAALAAECGAAVPVAELVPDDAEAFAARLDAAARMADLVVTSGGVSHGDFEVVRQVLEPRGAEVVEIAMQPGGPQATASVDGVPVVCFPGNPVSTQVSFAVLLRPLLRAAAGLPPIEPARARLADAVRSPDGRRQWLRGRLEGDVVRVVAGPGSHLVAAMARADVLVDVPATATFLDIDSEVAVLPL